MLYPLKFKPIFKDKIWGGQKIKSVLGMDYGELLNCGEVWLISAVEGYQSVVSNGFLSENELNELVEIYMGELVGEQVFEKYGNVFPLLIKIINSNDWLSIQVHPDDEYAIEHENEQGKNEAWVIIKANDEAKLIIDVKQGVGKRCFKKLLKITILKDA